MWFYINIYHILYNIFLSLQHYTWILNYYHFIMQTNKFLFIIVTATTLGQGQRKVIQYIFQTNTFCPTYLRFNLNGFVGRKQKILQEWWWMWKWTENIKSPHIGWLDVMIRLPVLIAWVRWNRNLDCPNLSIKWIKITKSMCTLLSIPIL